MKQSIAVLGLGRFGHYVAEELAASNADLMVVDRDPEIINSFSSQATTALIADLSKEDALDELGLSNMDTVIVCIGNELEPNIMSVMKAKEAGVKHVIARASSDIMANILTKVGADEIVYVEKESATRTARRVIKTNFLDYYDIGDDICVVHIKPKKEWIGHSLSELKLREKYNFNILAIRSNDKLHTNVDPFQAIQEDMEFFVVTEQTELDKFNK